MTQSRRHFLKQCAAATGLAVAGAATAAKASPLDTDSEPYGVLVDTTRCVGCRRCEKACNAINIDLPRRNDDYFATEPAPGAHRRMNDAEYTVVNRFDIPTPGGKPVHAKFQCMHCQKAACVSACIVGALTKDPTGAVRYDAWKCIGCRYCMQACPFQVPAYEYTNALTPQVRKCTFCHDARLTKEQPPACVESCPMEVMTFGPRSQVLAIARERMKAHPTRYTPHIYGENEVGGTSWLYLAAIPFEQLGFPKLGFAPTPGYTEPIQHAIFKWFLPPVALFATLGGVWKYMSTHHSAEPDAQEHPKP